MIDMENEEVCYIDLNPCGWEFFIFVATILFHQWNNSISNYSVECNLIYTYSAQLAYNQINSVKYI